MTRLATRTDIASRRCDCLAQPLPGDVPCRGVNDMPDVGPGKVPGRRPQDMPDGAAGGVPIRPMRLRVAPDTEPARPRSPKRARKLVYSRGKALVLREEPRDIPARKPWEFPDVGAQFPSQTAALLSTGAPCAPTTSWEDALPLTSSGDPDTAAWPSELGSILAHRPVGLSFGAGGRTGAAPGDPTQPRDELFTRNGEYVYSIVRQVARPLTDLVARTRWPIPKCTDGLWRDPSGQPIQAGPPPLSRESWAPMPNTALAHVRGDTLAGRRESVVLPYGRGGEYGLARLIVTGRAARTHPSVATPVTVLGPSWEIYPARMFQTPAIASPNTNTFSRVAASGDLVFVSLFQVGVAVWQHSNPGASDAYECLGLLRVPLWAGNVRLPIRDLHAREWQGRTYVFAALGAPADPTQRPTARTPRALVWEIDRPLLAAGVGIETFNQSVGVPIDGTGRAPFAAPGRSWMVLHPVGSPGRNSSSGVTTSVVDGELVLWVTGQETLDAFSLAAIQIPGALGTLASQSPMVEAAMVETGATGPYLIDERSHLGGVGKSLGPVSNQSGDCGGPPTTGVSSDYCNTGGGFQFHPSAAGRIAMAGNFRGAGSEAWLSVLSPSNELVKLGVTQRFPAAGGAMSELHAPFFHGSQSTTQGPSVATTHFLFGSIKAHLGRVDLQVPDPGGSLAPGGGLGALIDAVQNPNASGNVLGPGASAKRCTPQVCSSGKPGIPDSGIVTAEYGTGLGSGQTLVASPCLPATPMDPGATPGTQYPANSCAVFADEGLPPLVGFGYGGEWMDAEVAESRTSSGEYIVFLADRGSCAVHAHRTTLADGEAVDVFPAYDPRETDPVYVASTWPANNGQGSFVPGPPGTFQDDLVGYFPARNRVKGCRSVAVLPWLHSGVAGSIVASVGINDEDLALYVVPWEWLGARGRFVYDSTTTGLKFPVRFPFDAGGAWGWSAKGDVGGVRVLDDFFLVFFQRVPGIPNGASKDDQPPDLAIVDPRPLTSTTRAEFLMGSTLTYGRVDFPRDGSGALLLPGGPPNFRILDARVSGGRLYLLGDDTDADTFWLLTFDLAAQPGPYPAVNFRTALQLPTNHATSEAQRVKVSPDGQWLVTTFGDAEAGYLLLHVPAPGGVLGDPAVVAGLRYFGTWQRLKPAAAGVGPATWQLITRGYTVQHRGQDGITRAPLWPLTNATSPLLLASTAAAQAAVWVHGATAEFFATADGTLLLTMDTDPISIWRIDPGLLTPAASSSNPPGAPWLYVGAIPSDGSARQRLTWRTPDGMFHLGDTGNWAWAACDPLRDPLDLCPVKP